MLTYQVELIELPEQPVAVVHGRIEVSEVAGFLGAAFAEVFRVVGAQGLAPAGPPFGRFHPMNGTFDVEAGVPVTRAITPAGRVAPGVLLGGPVATVVHRGDYGAIGPAYQALSRWVDEHGYETVGRPWESYLDGPGVPEPRTAVYLPCRRRKSN